jgi:hypothetical protein
MSNDGPLSFQKTWEGFLPPNTIVMAKHAREGEAERRPVANAGPIAAPVRFGFETAELANPGARDLLDKIIAALEIPAADFAIFSGAGAGETANVAATLIRFAAAEDAPAGTWSGGVLTTYSLGAMLANPGLKKAVWAHLKDALKKGARRG